MTVIYWLNTQGFCEKLFTLAQNHNEWTEHRDSVLTLFGNLLQDDMTSLAPYLIINKTDFIRFFLTTYRMPSLFIP